MIRSAIRRSSEIAFLSALVLATCSCGPPPSPIESTENPWTHLDFLDGPETFHFAVVADRAGSHRPGVFRSALGKLDALGPAFVISVGDLLDTSDFNQTPDLLTPEAVRDRWTEFQGMMDDLSMPFFFVGGNNDLRSDAMVEAWVHRFGRTWYHFRYRDVLFLALNSEDPPGNGRGSMSEDQLTWLRRILAENEDVRWTFLFLHKPMWLLPDHPVWAAVEEALGDRPRTAFGGHFHGYSRTEVHGQVYYGLATTGGGSELTGVAEGQFDHVVWVTMTEEGPRISNLLLDGIWGDDPASEVGQTRPTSGPDPDSEAGQ